MKYFLVAAALFGLSFSAASAPLGLTPGAKAVRVAAYVCRFGENHAPGLMYERGIRLWADQVNARGGILGRPVTLVLGDAQAGASLAPVFYDKLIAQNGADLYLGPQAQGQAAACAPVFEKRNVACVLPTVSRELPLRSGKGASFGLLSALSAWPVGFFEMLSEAEVLRLAVISVDNAPEQTTLDKTVELAKRYGLAVVTRQEVVRQGLPAAMSSARIADAQALLVLGKRSTAPAVAALLRDMCWSPRGVYVFDGAQSRSFIQAAQGDGDGMMTSVPWDARMASAYPGGEAFIRDFAAAYGDKPDHYAAVAFAGGQVLEAACAKAKSVSNSLVRQALRELDVTTIVGRFGCDPQGVQIRQFPVTVQWQNGAKEILWPRQWRTAQPGIFR